MGLLQQNGEHRTLFWGDTHPNTWATPRRRSSWSPGRVRAEDAQEVPHPTPATAERLNTPRSRALAFPLDKGTAPSMAKQRLHRSSQKRSRIKISRRKTSPLIRRLHGIGTDTKIQQCRCVGATLPHPHTRLGCVQGRRLPRTAGDASSPTTTRGSGCWHPRCLPRHPTAEHLGMLQGGLLSRRDTELIPHPLALCLQPLLLSRIPHEAHSAHGRRRQAASPAEAGSTAGGLARSQR